MIFSRRLVVPPPLFIVLAIFHLLLINDCSCLSCFQCSNCVNPGLLAPCPEQYNFCVSFHGYRLFERYADKFCADFCPTDGTRVQKFSHFLYLFCFIFPFSFFLFINKNAYGFSCCVSDGCNGKTSQFQSPPPSWFFLGIFSLVGTFHPIV